MSLLKIMSNWQPHIFYCHFQKGLKNIWQLWIHCNKWQTGLHPDLCQSIFRQISSTLVDPLVAIIRYNVKWKEYVKKKLLAKLAIFYSVNAEHLAEVLVRS